MASGFVDNYIQITNKLIDELSPRDLVLFLYNVGSLDNNVSFYIVSPSDVCNYSRNVNVSSGINDFGTESKYYYVNIRSNDGSEYKRHYAEENGVQNYWYSV